VNFAVLLLLITGTFSLTVGFVADFLDPSFRTPEELANYLQAPVLAALPKGGE
jgi:capsular polysaccharide biosynthesis protein